MIVFIISESHVHNNLPQYLLKGLFNDKADPRLSVAFKILTQFAFRGALVWKKIWQVFSFYPMCPTIILWFVIRKHMINRFWKIKYITLAASIHTRGVFKLEEKRNQLFKYEPHFERPLETITHQAVILGIRTWNFVTFCKWLLHYGVHILGI